MPYDKNTLLTKSTNQKDYVFLFNLPRFLALLKSGYSRW